MRLIAISSLGFLLCGLAWPQATSCDQSGLAIPGAEVKVTQTATGAVRTVSAGTDGSYVLANLPIGPYLLEVTKECFSKYVQSGIVLQVDSNPTIDIPMKVGAVSEQVTVEANAAQVETRSTGLGQASITSACRSARSKPALCRRNMATTRRRPLMP